MKQILTVILFTLSVQLANGQACGIYRIKYVGIVTSQEKQIVGVCVPTTMFLEGFEKRNSKLSFIDDSLSVNGSYDIEISSHITTPYSNTTHLLDLYKKKSKKFILKVLFLERKVLKEKFIEIDWQDIVVSIIEDDKFGTLFKFNIKELLI
jgi:hypothetical protein